MHIGLNITPDQVPHYPVADVSDIMGSFAQVLVLERSEQVRQVGNLRVERLFNIDQVTAHPLVHSFHELSILQQRQVRGKDGRIGIAQFRQDPSLEIPQFVARSFEGLMKTLEFSIDILLIDLIPGNLDAASVRINDGFALSVTRRNRVTG
jgi:hypothetical protein